MTRSWCGIFGASLALLGCGRPGGIAPADAPASSGGPTSSVVGVAPRPPATPTPVPSPVTRSVDTPTDAFADVVVPAKGRVGKPMAILVYFVAGDGCTSATGATATVDEAERRVRLSGVLTRREVPGAGCTGAFHYPVLPVSFTPRSTGDYELAFRVDPEWARGGLASRLKASYPAQALAALRTPVALTIVVNVSN